MELEHIPQESHIHKIRRCVVHLHSRLSLRISMSEAFSEELMNLEWILQEIDEYLKKLTKPA